MVRCDNFRCEKQWFHYECFNLDEDGDLADVKWWCSEACQLENEPFPSEDIMTDDFVSNYSKIVTWLGLNEAVRHDAIRENDGPAMLKYWSLDMIQFEKYHHPKYKILGHRLLAGV